MIKRFSSVKSLSKPLPLSVLGASLLTAVALGWFTARTPEAYAADTPKQGAAPKAALTVNVTQARSNTLPVALAANGSVMAWQEALIGAEVSGLRVQELQASVGDWVKRGQVLATFAADSVQADVALARATLAEATASAAEATANAERARAVQNTGALSAQQVNQYLTAELTAQARMASAKAGLDSQLLRLKHTQLLAPDSGIVSARTASVGSVVGAGGEMFRLIRQGRLEWRAEVTSAELGRIAPGTAVLVSAPGGAQIKGKVRMVSPTVDVQTRNGLVYVDLPSGGKVTDKVEGKVVGNTALPQASVHSSFKPGMFARGEFVLGTSDALTVVQSAVMVRDGFGYVLRVGPDNRVVQLKVQTGRRVGDQIELLAGVTPQDRLVASGASFLSEGDVVRVVESAPAATK
jgi:HlyD family secretion protein